MLSLIICLFTLRYNQTSEAVRKPLVCFCTWSCDFSFLDELVVWKVLDDLLCDFPRVDFHPLRLQHLQHHKVTNSVTLNDHTVNGKMTSFPQKSF